MKWLSESIKKRALRYLLQRYLGNFLLEKLSLDQLSLDLYNGKGTIRDILLDVDTINEELNQLIAFKFIDGSIDELSVFVPWSSITTDSCSLHFDGISFNVCQLVNRKHNDFRESTIISKSLMTSSMQIAEEIVNEEQEKFDGLEMFAQLIDSVLRRFKLSASNTSFKFVAPRKSGDGQEIEIKIKYIKCEEEEQIGDNETNEQNLNLVSETITKIITLEGIEILINEVLICKLNGRHSIRLKIDENKTDLQIFLGSHIFAIITSEHLETLIQFFECGEQMPHEIAMTGEKLMNSEDFARVEQQLQSEAGYTKTANNTVISSSSVTIDSNKWANCGLIEDEPKFLPLKKLLEDKETTNTSENIAKKSQFLCHIKIPGLMLCLISSDHQSMPVFEGMPIIDSPNSFSRVNSCLDQILDGYNHMRFLALHLLFDITSDSFSLTCGDLMVNEVLDNKKFTILYNELNNQLITSPLLRFKMKDKTMNLNLSSICAKLDPTFLERYHKYFNLNSLRNNSQTNSDFNIKVNCNEIKAELFFPIPDLRPENERNSSQLREETLLIRLSDSTINFNLIGGEIKCKHFSVDFKISNTYSNILNAHSIDSKLIKLKFRIGSNGTINTTLNEVEMNNMFDAEMEDSIYIGQTAPQLVIEPFQVKRKVIGRGGDENEQVITPGDRQHMNKYLETSSSSAQLYFELFVPSVDIHFQNKYQFELLYNRIGNDLILWNPIPNMENNIIKESISQNPTFFSCKTAGMTDSCDSTSSSFHSFVGSNQNNRSNLMTFIFDINDITFEMGSKEEHTQNIFCQNLMVGIVVGIQENNNSTICLCGENLSLKSDDSVIISGNVYSEPNCTLNMAIDINRESDSLKKIKLALQLSCAAMYEIKIDVFEQFWRFINVEDELVMGYIPPKVITELHIDLVESAISLENLTKRPALITFEDIYLTSMVVENTNQTLLRIFAEETLFCFKRNKNALEAMKNYICVVQSGIIDLNLKLGKDGKLEFKLSNNAIDIRVCNDSFSALCQVISSLTSSSSPTAEMECNSTENVTFQDNLDGNLIEDALGENNEDMYESGDSDEEPPKFCNCESPPLDESGFWILGDDDLGAGIKMTSEPQIRVLTTEPVKVVENHFNISRFRVIPEITPSTLSRYLLEEMTLILHLYDGKDFDDDVANDTYVDKRNEETKSYKSGKSFSASEPRVRFADGSVHIWENIDLISAPTALRGSNSGQNICASSTFKTAGGAKRQYDTCVLLHLSKVKTLFENFDTNFPISWRFLFLVQDIEIVDRVSVSKIHKVLYEHSSESIPRRKHANMISIKATAIRNSDENSEESDLKISVKPLRVNIDQDTLLFLVEFFSTVIATISSEESENSLNTIPHNQINNNLPTYDEVVPFDDTESNISDATQETTVTNSSSSTLRNATNFSSSNSNKVFFKSFSFSPDVPIRLDYNGKHVDFDKVLILLLEYCF